MAKKKTPAKKQKKVPEKPQNTDFDNPWKDFIEKYFRDFMTFFFPHIEADIDWSKPITFLDKELQKIVRDAKIPKRYADKLVQVHRRSGSPALVISHIEVQNEGEDEFNTRMYSYNYRLRDRYNCAVVSLAILTDSSRNWRPTGFREEIWGSSTEFRFPIVKLLDFQNDWAALEASRNPFAVVTMAHLKTQATHGKPEEREEWKYNLTTMLYDQGYSDQSILELHHFLDWMLILPKEYEERFQARLKAFEEIKSMKYVTSIERMAEERAEERQKQAIALNLLKQGLLSIEAIAQATGLTISEVEGFANEQIQQLQADNLE